MKPDETPKPRELSSASLVFCDVCHCFYLTSCDRGHVTDDVKTLESGGSKGYKR